MRVSKNSILDFMTMLCRQVIVTVVQSATKTMWEAYVEPKMLDAIDKKSGKAQVPDWIQRGEP